MPATDTQPLKSPFPYPGGKSRVADEVWRRFGNVDNFIEPFMGSLAVLLRRPADHFAGGYRVETANDASHFICLGPDTRMLRADLTWMRAGAVQVGDVLVGFDEHNGPAREGLRAPTSYRKWRLTAVTAVRRVVKPSYRLTFDDGTTVVASEDHLWLSGSHPPDETRSGGRGWRWLHTKGLIGNRKAQRSWVLKLAPVIDREESWEAGWLGGIFDGEGSVAAKTGWRLTVAQNQGITLDRICAFLRARGFNFSRTDRPGGCSVLLIHGGMREVLRLLMLVRPERLIKNAIAQLPGRSLYGRDHQAAGLVEKEFLGDREVVAIETDSHTFVAEGLASHNCNFWRAVKAEPEKVAEWADWPVAEADLHARHRWLVRSDAAAAFRERMRSDPDHYDAKVAGWWVWGQCLWIGGAWCTDARADYGQLPPANADVRGYGVNRGGAGVHAQRPELSNGHSTGRGVNGRPQLCDAFDIGRGVHSGGALAAKVPRLGARFGQMDAPGVLNPTHGTCEARRAWLTDWMKRLADRLRLVRTCYGHWSRVCGSESTLTRLGTTGVFLDPPYPAKRGDTGKKSRDDSLYINDKTQDLDALRDEVLAWCRKWGPNPLVRAAVCGYEGDGYESLLGAGWSEFAWEANGGYANQRRAGKGKAANARRERIWFSPHCVAPNNAPSLFDDLDAGAGGPHPE